MKKLKDNPLYEQLNKRNPINNNYILMFNKFETLYDNCCYDELESKDVITLINDITYYIKAHLNNEVTSLNNNISCYKDGYYNAQIEEQTEDKPKGSSRISHFLSFYEVLLKLDTGKKSIIWNPRNIAFIDQFAFGQKMLDKIDSNLFKKSKYKEEGINLVNNNLMNNNNNLLRGNEDLLKKKLDYYLLKFDRYGKKPQWNIILKKHPSLFNAMLASSQDYELNHKELLDLYNNLYEHIKTNRTATKKASEYAEIYSKLLMESKYFEHSLVPTKNIRQAISNFLNTILINDPESGNDIFSHDIIAYPQYDFYNMQAKIKKHNNFKVLGKFFVTPEDEKKVEELLLASKPAPKRNKI